MATLVSIETVGEGEPQEELIELQDYADNFDHICRLCLSKERLVAIYSNVQGRNVYYVRHFIKFALDLLAVKINKHDALPNYLCERCEASLHFISNFKKKCNNSLAILQRVKDSINQAKESFTGSSDVDEKKLNVHRKRKMKAKSTRPNSEEILRKLPQGINVAKLDPSLSASCSVEQEPELVHQPRSATQCGGSVELVIVRTEQSEQGEVIVEIGTQEEHALDEAQDDLDQEQEVQEEPWTADQNIEPETEREIEFVEGEEKSIEILEEKSIEILKENDGLRKSKRKTNGRTRADKRADPKQSEPSKPSKKKKVACSICGTMVHNVKSHLIIHSDVRPHLCDQCPKSFTSRNKLQSHTNSVHLRKRDFKCDVCGKAFLEKNNLKGHMRIHNGERKYACDLCPKSFLFAGTLRCHKLTHTQEKRHGCHICGKLFLLRTTLNKHINVHTGERPHKCELCDKSFRTSTHKVVHMRTHTGEKPLICRICGMAFAHHKARSVHMKTKHPKELVAMGLIDDKGHLKL